MRGVSRSFTVATLGRCDKLPGELGSVINGLLKVSGRAPLRTDTYRCSKKMGGDYHWMCAECGAAKDDCDLIDD